MTQYETSRVRAPLTLPPPTHTHTLTRCTPFLSPPTDYVWKQSKNYGLWKKSWQQTKAGEEHLNAGNP